MGYMQKIFGQFNYFSYICNNKTIKIKFRL